jgi:hypothetical protein
MPSDTRTAYLFQCGDEELFAVSPDKAGEAIPKSSCTQGWLLRQEFQLGPQGARCLLLSNPSPSSAASMPRATTFGATPAGHNEQHIGCRR